MAIPRADVEQIRMSVSVENSWVMWSWTEWNVSSFKKVTQTEMNSPNTWRAWLLKWYYLENKVRSQWLWRQCLYTPPPRPRALHVHVRTLVWHGPLSTRKMYGLWQLGKTLFLKQFSWPQLYWNRFFSHRQSFRKVSAQLATWIRRRFGSSFHLNLQIKSIYKTMGFCQTF